MNQYFWKKSEFVSIHFNPFLFAGDVEHKKKHILQQTETNNNRYHRYNSQHCLCVPTVTNGIEPGTVKSYCTDAVTHLRPRQYQVWKSAQISATFSQEEVRASARIPFCRLFCSRASARPHLHTGWSRSFQWKSIIVYSISHSLVRVQLSVFVMHDNYVIYGKFFSLSLNTRLADLPT